MRWLVDGDSHPDAHAPSGMAHAHPPGPGFPEHAPSVYTVVATRGSWLTMAGLKSFPERQGQLQIANEGTEPPPHEQGRVLGTMIVVGG